MKKIANMSIEELQAQLNTANAELAHINEQLKATRKTRKAYEKLEAALKEQRKAQRKVVKALERVIDAQETEERISTEPVETYTSNVVVTDNIPVETEAKIPFGNFIDFEDDLTPEEEAAVIAVINESKWVIDDEVKPIRKEKVKFHHQDNRKALRNFVSHKCKH